MRPQKTARSSVAPMSTPFLPTTAPPPPTPAHFHLQNHQSNVYDPAQLTHYAPFASVLQAIASRITHIHHKQPIRLYMDRCPQPKRVCAIAHSSTRAAAKTILNLIYLQHNHCLTPHSHPTVTLQAKNIRMGGRSGKGVGGRGVAFKIYYIFYTPKIYNAVVLNAKSILWAFVVVNVVVCFAERGI